MNFMKKIKEKFSSKPKIFQYFDEAADNTYKLMDNLALAIKAFCNNNLIKIDEYAKLSIRLEEKLHQNYNDIVDEIYSREVMTFSREDRQYMISQLTEIGDFAYFVIRRFEAHHPEINKAVSDILLSGVPFLRQSGKLIKNLVNNLLYDFEEAKTTIWELHNLQRKLWDYELKFLKAIYKTNLKPENIIYYEIIMRNLKKIIMIMVRFGYGARELILKYTL
ncbi:MAG: hypothetical protein U9O98_11725 [Asgard group archaeon]|nr:hypothetical protein [Asgard group archaeon]